MELKLPNNKINECRNCGNNTITIFCSKSCSATHNNSKRTMSLKTKQRISNALAGTTHSRGNSSVLCKVRERYCSICNKHQFVSVKESRKTCSEECMIEAKVNRRSYRNGRRILYEYYCKSTESIVWLESSWELKIAQKLDAKGIEWNRPSGIKWLDKHGKIRTYFADFYLPNQAIYVDPKNPYCMEQDREKMAAIKQQIQIVYGEVNAVLRSLSVITGRKLH